MKKYENPMIEVEAFCVEDVVTTSTTGCDTEMPEDEV